MARRTQQTTPIDAIQHADTRVNIPTEELRDFVVEDEDAPGTMLYPRDPSLDPHRVWHPRAPRTRLDPLEARQHSWSKD